MITTIQAAICFVALAVSFFFGFFSIIKGCESIPAKVGKWFLAILSLCSGIVFTVSLAQLILGPWILKISATQGFLLIMSGFIPGWIGFAVRRYFLNRASSKQQSVVINHEPSM
jgi:hypothetical protein